MFLVGISLLMLGDFHRTRGVQQIDDPFVKRRGRLTKLWFCLLAFNIFLYTEAAETLFSNTTEPAMVAQVDCSSLLNIANPEPQRTQFVVLSFALGLSAPESQSFGAITSSSFKNFFVFIAKSHFLGFHFPYSFRDQAKVSGLSPPFLS